MAIIVEEEKQGPGILIILGTVLIIAILLFATWTLFFSPAPKVEVLQPKELERTSEVSKIELNVSSVTESPTFQSLKKYVENPIIGTTGRVNPFEPF